MTTAYPLSWPEGWPRTPQSKRVNGKSKWSSGGKPWTFTAARVALADELDRLGATNVTLSTNYELRLDGNPRAGAPKPSDTGIAVYFTYRARQRVMARDAYDRAEENMRSLSLAIRAMRALEEHGGSTMMDRAFEGFTALPPPGASRPWREVLGFPPGAPITAAAIEAAFRAAMKRAHPDTGGSHAAASEVNAARDAALKEIGL
jgi:hypothetical protein